MGQFQGGNVSRKRTIHAALVVGSNYCTNLGAIYCYGDMLLDHLHIIPKKQIQRAWRKK